MTPARIWNVVVFPAPSGPINPKISPSRDFEIDTADGIERRRIASRDREPGWPCARGRSPRAPSVPRNGIRDGHLLNRPAGQTSPWTRISPSDGMPGLANPMAPLSSSLTPTTCFTRSSRK